MESKIEIRSTYVDMTPELAQRYLATQRNNRPLNRLWVTALSEMIKRGEWILDGNSIKMDKNGHLIDGQHRLAAVVKCGISVPMEVKSGFDYEAIHVIDAYTKTRSVADVFALEGTKNHTQIASGIRVYNLERHGLSGKGLINKLSPAEAIGIYSESPDAWQKLATMSRGPANRRNKRLPLLNSSLLVGYGAFLVIDKGHTFERVSYFFEQLCSSQKSENVNIEKLRNALLVNKFSNRRYTTDALRTLVVKTWNSYVSGSQLSLRLIKDEPRAEFI